MFQRLFHHARRAFWVFQMQHAIELLPPLTPRADVRVRDDDPLYAPIAWPRVLAGDKLALPLLDGQPGFSFAHQAGPVSLMVADLRSERSQEQVMGPASWDAMQRWLAALPAAARARAPPAVHVPVPVVHPKLSLAEAFMDSFGQDHVLDSSADDLRITGPTTTTKASAGAWSRPCCAPPGTSACARPSCRATCVAAWGVVYRKDVEPADNWAQIQQLTSTAVVHPSLVSVMERLFFHVLNSVAGSAQTLDVNLSAEMMLFPGSNRYVMAARNWLALELDEGAGKLWASWRCETKESFTNHLLATDPVRVQG